MALPADFPIVSPTSWVQSGIIVSIVPSWSNRASNGEPATNFVVELQRAPDSSGIPGTPVTIAQLAPIPRTGAFYTDTLPFDGAKRYYRFRHIRTGWTAGIWSPYTRGTTPVFLDALIPVNPTGPILLPNVGDGGINDETIGPDGIIVFGPDGRDQIVFNGNAENGLSYWQAVKSGAPLDAPIPVWPGVDLALETGSPFAGTASLKFTAVTNGGIQQTVRPTDATAESTGPLLFRVRAGDRFHIAGAFKASSASTVVNVWLRLYINVGILEDTVSLIAQFQGIGTSWVELETTQIDSVVIATQKYASVMVTTNSTDGRTVYIDQLTVNRAPGAADLAGTIAPVTIDGWTQDNVAASQTNVELTRATGRWRAVQAGSVTGVVATMTEARTAGTLTVTVFKNTGLAGATGASVGLTAVIDGTNTSRKATTQAKDLDTFVAGDELYLVVTTDGSWTPTTSDLRAALEVEI